VTTKRIDPESSGKPVRAVPVELIRRSLNEVFEAYRDIPYSVEMKIKAREALRKVALRSK
jgi:hypothetical protein